MPLNSRCVFIVHIGYTTMQISNIPIKSSIPVPSGHSISLLLGCVIYILISGAAVELNAQKYPAPSTPDSLIKLPLEFNMDDENIDWENYVFHPVSGAEVERVENPDKSGLNQTDYVLKYEKVTGPWYAGFYYHLEEGRIAIGRDFKLKVWSPVGGIHMVVQLHLQDDVTVFSQTMIRYIWPNEAGQWVELRWGLEEYGDFLPSQHRLSRWDKILIIAEHSGPGGEGGERFTWYVDDFRYVEKQATNIEQERAGIPQELTLYQNYPNPFNPATQIRFGVPEASHVHLSVYDMLGRQVAVLVNEDKSQGWHDVSFDAAGLASGTYIYRLAAGSFSETRAMTLLK